ncbi:MAG: TetR/AcrR family transcriptional regulator [Xanthobacteraceae bacterium]
MARRPRQRSRKSGNGNGGSQAPENNGANGVEAAGPRRARTTTNRGKIIEAFMELLGEQPIEAIDYPDIAARAGVSMADMRGEFGSKLAILAAHVKNIDREVLSGDHTDMAEEPPRERLFDVLMRRLEAQEPYKDAIRSLLRSARANPGLACALNSLALRSQRWMLAGADLPSSGPAGLMRAQGLAILYGQVLATFVDDDDPGHARTMARLDRALSRGEWWAGVLDNVCRLVPGCASRRRSHPAMEEDDGAEPVAI